MGMLDDVTTGPSNRPRRTVMYGPPGVGKTTAACKAPAGILVPTEDGAGDIDGVARLPLIETWGVLGVALNEIANSTHGYKSVILDSLDWAQALAEKAVAIEEGKDHVSEIAFGRGFVLVADKMKRLLGILDTCRDRGMQVVCTAHSHTTKVEDPSGQTWDTFAPRLHKHVLPIVVEWADELLFCSQERFVGTKTSGNKERGVARSLGDRVIHTQEGPYWLAKSRLSLEPTLPLDGDAYFKNLTKEN